MPTKPTYESGVDFGSLFDADWQKAQARYQQGLNAGYDPATAETLYIKPIQAKWKIIQLNPDEFQSEDKLNKINEEFDSATAGSIKSMTAGESIDDAVSRRFAPVVQRWSVAAVKPTMTFEQQETVKNLGSDINRLKAKRGTYTRELTNALLDKDSRAAKMAAVNDINSQLEDLTAQYQQALRGGTQEVPQVQAAPQPAPSGFSALRQSVPDVAAMPNLYGTGSPDIQMPQPPSFGDRLVQMNQSAQPEAAPGPRPITFISGRPDLSNVTREEADAAWAARFNRPQRPTPPDREEVESPAAKANQGIERFDSEKTAREQGYKAGDIIYLTGVGKVRLK